MRSIFSKAIKRQLTGNAGKLQQIGRKNYCLIIQRQLKGNPLF